MNVKTLAGAVKKELKAAGIRCRTNTTAYQFAGPTVNVLVFAADIRRAEEVLAGHGAAVHVHADPDEGV